MDSRVYFFGEFKKTMSVQVSTVRSLVHLGRAIDW